MATVVAAVEWAAWVGWITDPAARSHNSLSHLWERAGVRANLTLKYKSPAAMRGFFVGHPVQSRYGSVVIG